MSVGADTLLELAELRLEPEQMAGVLRILGRMQAKEDARKQGQRERVRRHREKRYGNVTETVQSGYTPPQKEKSPPAPPLKKNTPPQPSSDPVGSPDGERAERATNPETTKASALSELGKVLDAKHAADVVEHRKRMGSPLTASAAAKLAAKLAKWPDPNEAADEMLANGWQGFEADWLIKRRGQGPPANDHSGTVTILPSRGQHDRHRSHRPTQTEQLDAAFERRYGYRAGND